MITTREDAITVLHSQGLNQRQIARALNTGTADILDIFRKLSLEHANPLPLEAEEIREMRTRTARGESSSEIAASMRIDPDTVRSISAGTVEKAVTATVGSRRLRERILDALPAPHEGSVDLTTVLRRLDLSEEELLRHLRKFDMLG